MRARLVILAALLLLLTTPALAAAQTTRDFEATFRESFGRGNAPSGVGHVLGAQVTEVFTFVGFEETGDPQCPVTTTGSTLFTWPDGSTLTTEEHYQVCFPGKARSAPGSEVSYGNPETTTGTFEIVEATGFLTGAFGSGDIKVRIAGDVIIIHYSGTVTFG